MKLPGMPEAAKQPKPNALAVPSATDPVMLLAQIRDALQQLVPSGQQEDYQDYQDIVLGTAAGSKLVEPDGQIGWLYIPDAPRDISVWSGAGRGRFLGTVTAGSYGRFRIPKGQAVLLEWGAGTASTLSYWVSSREIGYEALNPDILSGTAGLAAAIKEEDTAHASGDVGVMMLGVRNESFVALSGTNGDYTPIATKADGTVFVAPMYASVTPIASALTVGVTSYQSGAYGFPGVVPIVSNGSTYDRLSGNVDGTALASAARTAYVISADIINYNGRGILIFLNVTAASGTGGLQVRLMAKDPVSGTYFAMAATPTAVTATGKNAYVFYPGSSAGAAGNVAQNVSIVMPRTIAIEVIHGDGTSYTYSVGYSIIL